MAEDNKKKAYHEFIATLPRVCSPTICGLLKSDKKLSGDDNDDEKMEIGRNCSLIDFDQINSSNLDNNEFEFNWSIEQIALLNPLDFSNEHDDIHEIFSDDHLNHKLDQENEHFFKQEIIAPSPATHSTNNSNNLSRLLDDSHMLSLIKTPVTNDNKSFRRSVLKKLTKQTPINAKILSKKKLFNENEDNISIESKIEIRRQYEDDDDEILIQEGISHISCIDIPFSDNSIIHCGQTSSASKSYLTIPKEFDCLSPIVFKPDEVVTVTPPNHSTNYLLLNNDKLDIEHRMDSGCPSSYSQNISLNITSTPCCIKD